MPWNSVAPCSQRRWVQQPLQLRPQLGVAVPDASRAESPPPWSCAEQGGGKQSEKGRLCRTHEPTCTSMMATDTIKVQPVQPQTLVTEGKYGRRQFEEVLPTLTLEPSDASAFSLVKTQACSKDSLFAVNITLMASSNLPQHPARWLRGYESHRRLCATPGVAALQHGCVVSGSRGFMVDKEFPKAGAFLAERQHRQQGEN